MRVSRKFASTRSFDLCSRRPERLHECSAVIDHGASLSYGELLVRAAAVQQLLLRRGVGVGDVVGFSLPRSANYVVALLGVWLSGAAFLPLPPELPERRREDMLAEAEVSVLLSAEDLRSAVTQSQGALPPSETARLLLARMPRVGPGDLAYVIYTSGSSGKSKGVLVPQRGLRPLVQAQVAAFGLNSASRLLWLHSTAFDAHVSDVVTTLSAGATLVIDDCGSVTERLFRYQISHVDIPPVLLRLFEPAEAPPSLTTLVVGGESSPPDVLRKWARTRRVVGVYGPTEATVCTSLCVVDAASWDRPLLGQPLPGTQYLVIDAEGQQGEEGELFIAGDQLAQGYLKDEKKTQARFVTRADTRSTRVGIACARLALSTSS